MGIIGKILNPCYMLAEKSDSSLLLLGLACFAFVVCCLITGKTLEESKYNAIGAIVERDESPATFWWTLALMTLLGVYLWVPVFGCH